MSVAGSIDNPIEIIGGLVCDTAPSELPLGVSPDCQDMAFSQSAAATRPGLTSVFAAIAGNPTVNYVKTYENLQEVISTLVWDSAGNLRMENSVGVLTGLALALYSQSPYANSTTLFGKEYMAFGDGKVGQDQPAQWDGNILDRYTQGGPGAPPSVADYNPGFTIHASATGLTQQAGFTINTIAEPLPGLYRVTISVITAVIWQGDQLTISGATPSGFNSTWTLIVGNGYEGNTFYFNATPGMGSGTGGTAYLGLATCLLTAAPAIPLTVGGLVTIAGAGAAGYDVTTVPIISVLSSASFTYLGATPNSGGSGGGTASLAGSIAAGVHQVAVSFVLRKGYITKPSPLGKWTAGGNSCAQVYNIPLGPANAVGRILMFTTAGGANFYYIPPEATTLALGSTIINDNTTTSVVVNFNDAILLGATSADALFNQIALPEAAGTIAYNERLFWWGVRNRLTNLLNLDFNGGVLSAGGFPLGWTPDATYGTGGIVGASQSSLLSVYAIEGDGATATRGLITQSLVSDYLGTPIIQAVTEYSVRARVKQDGFVTQGAVHVHMYSALGGIDQGLDVTFGQATTAWKEFTAVLTPGIGGIATVPSDLVLRVYSDGTQTNGAFFDVGLIEIYPTNQPWMLSTVYASTAESPEQIDGVTGFLNVSENDGQAVRAGFELRGNLYFAKERSLHSTQDNGQEPSTWDVSRVSATVGTPSARGVGLGEDWAVIAGRAGLYIFNGGEPQKISQEVGHSASGLTLAWDQINWAYGHTLWVAVDTQERRILVGAPFGAATSPNYVLQLDYRDIDGGAAEIAAAPAIVVSYRGKKIVKDKSRKWCPWTISANCGAVVERFDGTQQVFLGGGAYGNQAPSSTPTGKVYQLDQTNITDDGLAIPSYYTMAYTPDRDAEQTLQMHAHRKLFYYLAMYCEGQGYLNVTAYPDNESNAQLCAQVRLASPSLKDLEATINVSGERVAFKVTIDTTVAGNWFRLQKFIPSMNGDPWAPVRGQN